MAPAFSWLKTDETAKEALLRILTERPSVVLPPPLHRLPLRAGNVVEIAGPSPSAKTLILTQAAISCVLPKERNAVQYGGLERNVFFIDLDCRFDAVSFSRALESRINGANAGLFSHVSLGLRSMKRNEKEYDKEFFVSCMRRFMYTRCYNSFEFLATLKWKGTEPVVVSVIYTNVSILVKLHLLLQTLHYQILRDKEKQGTTAYMLIIDSIGAFYWMDRALSSSSAGTNNRKSLSLQTITEAIVQEIQRLLQVHPMLVLAAKSATFGDMQSASEVIRNPGKWADEQSLDSCGPRSILSHRDYMPSVWQSFVSHRVLLRPSDSESKYHNRPAFTTEWLLPPLKFSDGWCYRYFMNWTGLGAVASWPLEALYHSVAYLSLCS
ncbi:DNA repair protein XRCC2 homolog [Striga asiatica]|uniref:DNA repair protein XRCC2 homolog n=1 Tax=Striga asiatica TaxID=4170 RepID=A0A5A7P4S7_STRAF|nr:DNA repair protein XRCC2 homolog [Striga asiatica]